MSDGGPTLPAYGGPCIASIVPALLEPGRPAPWLPAPVATAAQVVLFVVDGLGWTQLEDRRHLAPFLSSLPGGPITSVVPSTTATALTSIAVGAPPGSHGMIGYRVNLGPTGVLNVLRWQVDGADATAEAPPAVVQPMPSFGGHAVPFVTRAEYDRGGFTTALIGDRRIVGYRAPSSLAVEIPRQLAAGSTLVYAYYDGLDRIAHAHGFGPHYDAELRAVDRLLADLATALPGDAALLVTADHGQVEVGGNVIELAGDLRADVALLSGEGRCRWLHARPGRAAALAERARRLDDDGRAWVRTRDEAVAEGWFGPVVTAEAEARMGDVVLAARRPVAFLDPAEPGSGLVCRHGSLTPDEMIVPLVAGLGGGAA